MNNNLVYIKNKKGQFKRATIMSEPFDMDGEQYVMTSISDNPINLSAISNEKDTTMKSKSFNCTQLSPQGEFERHIYHRDQFAHYLRWTHVLKCAKIGMNILDFGSGSGEIADVFYRNRFKPNKYIGLEYRENTVNQATHKFENVGWAEFKQCDLTSDTLPKFNIDFDIITSFEVIEHIGVDNADKYLKNLKSFANLNTTILLSTPCYDHNSAAAGNHITDNEVNEYTYSEMENILTTAGFEIIEKYGTFASVKDYKPHLTDAQREIFDNLRAYYDSNMISVIMAPLFPEYSRNVIWKLKIKNS
jgi:cyclopropane fatty-acyl-phospholipid synthase-like methyltransferase